MNLKFTVEGETVLLREIRGITEDVSDLSEGFREAEKVFQSSVADNYQSENATGKSGRWEPLSERYLDQKVRKLGFLAYVGLERLSDRTVESLTGKTADTVSDIKADEASFGTTVPYARAQHFGLASRNLPARPLIDLSDLQLKAVGDAVRQTVVKTVKRKRTLVVTEENFDFV